MKRGFVSLALFITSFTALAQLEGAENKVSDSLKLNLQNAKNAKDKVK